jgi:hypothetical protein
MTDKMQYEFHGMDPSEWTAAFLEEELGPLLPMCPPDAHMKFKVDKHGDGLDGKLIIYSKAGPFIVEDKAGDITALTKLMKKKMKTQLHKWRETHQNHHGYGHGRAG